MSRHRDDHLELCAAHVLGVLDEAGRAELEAHLAEGCPECEAELRALSSGAFVLAMSVPQQRAPAAVRARVLAAIDAGGASGRQMGETSVIALPRRPWYASPAGALLAAAALIAVALAGVSAWRRTEELTRELTAARAHTDSLQIALDEERRWASVMTAPGARTVTLASTTPGTPALAAEVHYDPASDRALLFAQGFTAPSARDYELWAITAAGPTSLGVVRTGADGRAVVRLEHIARDGAVAAFAVSLEATGGSPDPHKPSGPVVMLGKIAG
jgi:anti-sigma-K factor RskA